MPNVVRFTQATRKIQEHISVSDSTDWTFAKKAKRGTETLSRKNEVMTYEFPFVHVMWI
jgi:hypothetical protein